MTGCRLSLMAGHDAKSPPKVQPVAVSQNKPRGRSSTKFGIAAFSSQKGACFILTFHHHLRLCRNKHGVRGFDQVFEPTGQVSSAITQTEIRTRPTLRIAAWANARVGRACSDSSQRNTGAVENLDVIEVNDLLARAALPRPSFQRDVELLKYSRKDRDRRLPIL